MDVFLNEESLNDRKLKNETDITEVVEFLHGSLKILNDARIKPFSRIAILKNWAIEWDEYLDFTIRKYFLQIYANLENRDYLTGNFHYNFFSLTRIDIKNYPNTSIAYATDKIIQKQQTAVLNIPISGFCGRNFLPIIKSSFDPNIKDEFVNIPCFNDATKIIHFKLLHERIEPYINNVDKFELFLKEYYSFIAKFNFTTWEPKTYIKGQPKLDSAVAFPANSNLILKNELAGWKIVFGSYEENKARYKILGAIVLEIHGYKKNIELSRLYKYDIFEAGHGNKKLLVSIDTENGLFEVIESDGTHIGVYNYDGKYKKHYTDKKKLNDHSLKGMPTDLFIY